MKGECSKTNVSSVITLQGDLCFNKNQISFRLFENQKKNPASNCLGVPVFMNKMYESKSIIIFDGVCNLCNGTVNFLLKHDRKKQFVFTALQSTTGRKLMADYKINTDNDSVILISNQTVFVESAAALEIGRLLPFPWRMVLVFYVVPAQIRDKVYRWIARNRFKWFGKRKTCRIPTDKEKEYFL